MLLDCVFLALKLILSFSYEVFCILEHLWFFTKQGWTSEWKTGEKKSFFTHERNSFKKSFEWCCRSKDSAFILSLFEGNLMKKLLWCILPLYKTHENASDSIWFKSWRARELFES